MKQLWAAGILISLSILTFQTDALAQVTPRRVIIDTDPGTDDAMAIILALNSPEFKVEALTVVPGNVDAQQGLENALKIVSLAGRCDVAVAGGAQHPLNQKLITAQFWHGKNGLANVESVSYTHLDVYKRQVKNLCAIVRGSLCPRLRLVGGLDGVANVFAIPQRSFAQQTPID